MLNYVFLYHLQGMNTMYIKYQFYISLFSVTFPESTRDC